MGDKITNLIANSNFLEGLTFWQWEAYNQQSTTVVQVETLPDGSKCATIEVPEGSAPTDIIIFQCIYNLDPNKWYNIRALAKGENVETLGEMGVNVCSYDPTDAEWNSGSGNKGTFDWKELVASVRPSAAGVLRVGLRLGYFNSSATRGKAYFKDVKVILEEYHNIIETGKVSLFVEKNDFELDAVGPATLMWVRKLNNIYNEMLELTGIMPASGQNLKVVSLRQLNGTGMLAGIWFNNPLIKWQQQFVHPTLLSVKDNNIVFGICHEFGHLFDTIWQASNEWMPQVILYYAINQLNYRVQISDVWYIGVSGDGLAPLINWYKQDYDNNIQSWNRITYRLILIANQVGWEQFTSVFGYFSSLYSSNQAPATNRGKWDLMISSLSGFVGFDVNTLFEQSELDWVYQQYPV